MPASLINVGGLNSECCLWLSLGRVANRFQPSAELSTIRFHNKKNP